MRRTLAIIGGVIAVLLAAVLIYAATKPDVFRIQRATSIKAPPEKIAAVLGDFHGWEAWSPWEKLDPSMKRSHSGTAKGKGAVYTWEGNSEVGQGRMEITEASSQGPLPYVAKVVHVVFDMDGMVGKQFETGLANLKAVAEK
jgi:K+-transporting ATPase KdpF subunit